MSDESALRMQEEANRHAEKYNDVKIMWSWFSYFVGFSWESDS